MGAPLVQSVTHPLVSVSFVLSCRRFYRRNGTGILQQVTDHATGKSWIYARRLIREHVSPQRMRLLGVLLCMIIQAAATTMMAKMMEPMVNAAFLHGNMAQIYGIAIVVVVVF